MKSPKTFCITTIICGRTNYIHHFINGMQNRKMPVLTIEPERAQAFDSEQEATDMLANLSPGYKDRNFLVEPTPVALSRKTARKLATLDK